MSFWSSIGDALYSAADFATAGGLTDIRNGNIVTGALKVGSGLALATAVVAGAVVLTAASAPVAAVVAGTALTVSGVLGTAALVSEATQAVPAGIEQERRNHLRDVQPADAPDCLPGLPCDRQSSLTRPYQSATDLAMTQVEPQQIATHTAVIPAIQTVASATATNAPAVMANTIRPV